MDVNELEKQILLSLERGDEPLMVNATAGTTVLGAFDPLHSIADLCEKYDIWMHADVRGSFRFMYKFFAYVFLSL